MNKLDLENPKRQSLIGIAVIFFRNLRIAINILVTVVFVQFGIDISFLGLSFYQIIIILAALFLIISFLQYRRFFFFVQDGKFVIEKGLLNKDKITIPLDRIQTVNIHQNLVQRLLGVVGLKVDTAGSKGKEIEILALENRYARKLQKFLVSKKEQQAEEGEKRSFEISNNNKKPLISLGILDLVKIGITENHLRSGLFLFVVINGYIWQYEEYLLEPFEPYLREKANNILAQGLILLPIEILLFVVISAVFSLIQILLRYYNLKFYVNMKEVRLQSGLLRHNEFQFSTNKIQQVKWKSNPLRRLVKLRTIVVKQASSEKATDRQSVSVPGSSSRQLVILLQNFFPERSKKHFVTIKAKNFLFIQLLVWVGIIPSLLLSSSYFLKTSFYLLAPAYLVGAAFFVYRYCQSVQLNLMPEILEIKKGWFYPSVNYIKLYKLQNVKLKQSLFQKHRKLMNITFYTAAGDITMPHLTVDEAKTIFNYSLYKIESSDKNWM